MDTIRKNAHKHKKLGIITDNNALSSRSQKIRTVPKNFLNNSAILSQRNLSHLVHYPFMHVSSPRKLPRKLSRLLAKEQEQIIAPQMPVREPEVD